MDKFAYIAKELRDLIELAEEDRDQLQELSHLLSMALEQAEVRMKRNKGEGDTDEAPRALQQVDANPAALK